MVTSRTENPKYTVLRATVCSLRLIRLVRFASGKYGVLDGDITLHVEPADVEGRRRAIAAFEENAASRVRRDDLDSVASQAHIV